MSFLVQHIRSGEFARRPQPLDLAPGQLAVNYNTDSTGLFFRTDNGELVKVGPVHVGSGSNGLHFCGFDFIRVSPASSGTPGNGNGPDVNMEFRGNTGFRILSGATYGTISDAKVKDNIVDATPKLSDLMQLRVRNFSTKGNSEAKFIGFIAQEFEEVFPTLVSTSKDYITDEETGEVIEGDTETKGIKDSALIPILVKSLQEAVARIETLEVTVAAIQQS